MATGVFGKAAARLADAVRPFSSKARAVDFARLLRDEYRAGQAEVADRKAAAARGADDRSADDDARDADEADDRSAADDERTIVGAVRDIDWAAVRQATSARTGEIAQRMKAMAGEVDWRSVQPAAAHVSSALIAAVASGHLPLGGKLGSTVARAIMNDGGLAQRVGATMTSRGGREQPHVPDFRGVIDTTATEADD